MTSLSVRAASKIRRLLRGVVPLLAAGFAVASPLGAQSAAECLACHEDDTLVAERDGVELSAFVDEALFGASIHAGMACVDCHQDLVDQGDGHDDVVAPVDCSTCHDDTAEAAAQGIHGSESGGRPAAACADCHAPHSATAAGDALDSCTACHGEVVELQHRSLHGRAAARGDRLAPTCVTCHGSHRIVPHRDPASPVSVMNIPLLCGGCHKEGTEVSLFRDIPQESILEHYVDSIHGEGLFQKGLTVTAVCTSCHTSHDILPHTDRRSSIAKQNVVGTCMQCHAQIEQVHRKVIDGELWEKQPHLVPVCIECHQPHEARRVFYDAGMANRDCLICHGREDLTTVRDGETVSLWVDADAFAASEHKNTACAQCHSEVQPSHERPCDAITAPVDCSVCHAAVVDQYESSIHGKLHAQGDGDAPVCLDCHSNHATQDPRDPTAPTFARNVPQLCARCHRAGEKAAVRIQADVPDIVASYADSIHGRGLTESGLIVTATCINCHTSHGELPPADPASSVHRENLPQTCGQCHHGVAEEFATSIHATGEPRDGMRLPVCEDCHTSHSIVRHDLPGSRTRMMEQCGTCHEEQTETFFDTFHGKVSRLGTEAAAKCSDCHGSHAILPPTDPASTLSRANVVETCAQCHPGSNRRFAGYLTHSTHHDKDRWPWLYWSFRFMTLLLIGTLTFALLHTGAWLVRLMLSRDQWQHIKAMSRVKRDGEKLYRRFTSFQRTLHLVMLLSFFTLALTGMALKFSYAGWAQLIATLLGGQPAMAVLHRIGAIVLLTVFAFHVRDVVRKRRESGRTWKEMLTGPDTILFHPRDLKDIVGSIKWFFGIGPRPSYGRYTYWEKFDYFAVFWGVMVIGSTGFVLWFPELLTRVLPGWSINVATIVHSDEALLAVGFIFTIHFFNTHFRPDKFPMDPVIFTGRMTLEELKHDKPDEYAEMVRTGKLEEHLVDPMPEPVARGFKIFGFVALAIGLTLIVLIVYAMLFGYR